MVVGSWGDLVFEVSDVRIKTIGELTRKSSGRWSEHLPINTAPISQFLGPGLNEIELKMDFLVMLGANPKEDYESLEAMVRKGTVNPMILGGVPVSKHLWYCKEITGTSEVFAPKDGKMLSMECTAVFKEYN